MVNMADLILAITPEDKKRLIDLYKVEEQKIVVLSECTRKARRKRKRGAKSIRIKKGGRRP